MTDTDFFAKHQEDKNGYSFRCERYGDFLAVFEERGGEKAVLAQRIAPNERVILYDGSAPTAEKPAEDDMVLLTVSQFKILTPVGFGQVIFDDIMDECRREAPPEPPSIKGGVVGDGGLPPGMRMIDMSQMPPEPDGVSLLNTAHPGGDSSLNLEIDMGDLSPDSIETIEIELPDELPVEESIKPE